MLLARCVDSRSDFLETTGDETAGTFHSRNEPSFCSAGLSFVLCLFGCSLLGRLFGFRELKQRLTAV